MTEELIAARVNEITELVMIEAEKIAEAGPRRHGTMYVVTAEHRSLALAKIVVERLARLELITEAKEGL